MLQLVEANADHALSLIDATWLKADSISPLILQAVFRELMIDVRPTRDAARRLIERFGGQS